MCALPVDQRGPPIQAVFAMQEVCERVLGEARRAISRTNQRSTVFGELKVLYERDDS
jgi:hypothetical protein